MKFPILIALILCATAASAEVEINCYRSGDVTDTSDQQLSIRGNTGLFTYLVDGERTVQQVACGSFQIDGDTTVLCQSLLEMDGSSWTQHFLITSVSEETSLTQTIFFQRADEGLKTPPHIVSYDQYPMSCKDAE